MIERPQIRQTTDNIVKLADQCVQCGLCLPHCPTYQLDKVEAESPRGRIAYMKAVATQQIAPTSAGDTHLDHCLGCRRCESACPADVHYGDLFALARAEAYQRKAPAFFDRFIANALPRPALLSVLLPLARASQRLPKARSTPSNSKPSDEKHSKQVAIFEGCIAKSYESGTRKSLANLLQACDIEMINVKQQTCCGAAAVHQGDHKTSEQLAKQNRVAFSSKIPVISLASGCHEALKQSLSGHTEVVDAFDYLANHRQKLRFKAADQRIAWHIPCTQSTVVKSVASLRTLLGMVPNLDIFELPDNGCCGAAGLHMMSYPQRADAMRSPLLKTIEAAKVAQIISGNIGCRLHLANASKLSVRHPIDFLAEHLL
jgi:glycolate oxidase iron-sulfur subunit